MTALGTEKIVSSRSYTLSVVSHRGITYAEVWQSVKDLLWLRLGRVEDIPVVDRGVRNHTQTSLAEPLPVDNIFIHDRGLELLLGCEIENLNCSTLGLESNDVLGPVHDSTVRVDGPLDNFIVVLQINDDDLRFVFFIKFLADTDEVIRF